MGLALTFPKRKGNQSLRPFSAALMASPSSQMILNYQEVDVVHGGGTGDRRQHITNNNNNNIIRIIIKELGKKQEGRGRMRQKRGGYLRQHLAVASLAEKEKKKKRGYISIYRQGRKGWAGTVLSPLPDFTTQPWADGQALRCTR